MVCLDTINKYQLQSGCTVGWIVFALSNAKKEKKRLHTHDRSGCSVYTTCQANRLNTPETKKYAGLFSFLFIKKITPRMNHQFIAKRQKKKSCYRARKKTPRRTHSHRDTTPTCSCGASPPPPASPPLSFASAREGGPPSVGLVDDDDTVSVVRDAAGSWNPRWRCCGPEAADAGGTGDRDREPDLVRW